MNATTETTTYQVITTSQDISENGLYRGQQLVASAYRLERDGHDPYKMQGLTQKKLATIARRYN